jgi:murein DD-endopeptidase MepM/ murein hydrolase activator NlpD
MPYAPQYESQTNAPQGSQVRLAAADHSGFGQGLAQGMQSAGRSISVAAEIEGQIQQRNDALAARRMRNEFLSRAQPIYSEYSTRRGVDAVMEAGNTQQALIDLAASIRDGTDNKRQRGVFEALIGDDLLRFDTSIVDYSVKQQNEVDIDTTKSEMSISTQQAVASHRDPELHRTYIEDLQKDTAHLARLMGLSAQSTQDLIRTQVSQARLATVQAMLGDPNFREDEVIAYFEKHADDFQPREFTAVNSAIQEPLKARAFDRYLNNAGSGATSPAAAGVDESAGDGGATASGASGSGEAQPLAATPNTLPVRGQIKSGYGNRRNPFTRLPQFHNGIDIAAPMGAAIKPSADGEVTEVGNDPNQPNGYFIRIKHSDGHESVYLHMKDKPTYGVGDRVTQSTIIGSVGSTGSSTGPHLHFAVKDKNGNYVDPQAYLKGSTAGMVGSPSEPRKRDRIEVLTRIDRDEAAGVLTREQADDYRIRAERLLNRDEALLNEGYKQADDAMSKWLFNNLENFTDFNQIPSEIARGFSPSQALRYKEMALSNAKALATKNPEADITEIYLKGVKALSPEVFEQMDLSEYAPKLGQKKYAEMLLLQGTVKDERAKAGANWTPAGGINEAYNRMRALDGVKYNEVERSAIGARMEEYANRRFKENGGKPLTPAEYDDAYRFATEEVTLHYSGSIGSFFNPTGKGPRYKADIAASRATEANATERESRARTREVNAATTRLRADFYARRGRFPTTTEMNILLQEAGF